jgi:hypothetical protein
MKNYVLVPETEKCKWGNCESSEGKPEWKFELATKNYLFSI